MIGPDRRSASDGKEQLRRPVGPSAEDRGPWLVAVLIFVAILVANGRLALSHDKALNDRLNYFLTARTLAEGGGLAVPAKSDLRVPDRTSPYVVGERPLYPFLASLAIRLAGPHVQTTNFVSALMRSLALFPIFALALWLFGRWTAIGAAILYALSPPWTGLGATTMTDTTFALFYYLALMCAAAYWRRPSRALALGTGLAFALTVMSREEGLLLGVGLVLILLLQPQWATSASEGADVVGPGGLKGLARRSLGQARWRDLALFAIGPALGWIGQKYYLYHTFGSFSSSAHPLFFNSQYEFLFALRLQTPAEYFASIGGVGGAILARIFTHLSQIQAFFADGLLIDTGQAGLFPLTFLIPLGLSVRELAQKIRARQSQAVLIVLVALVVLAQALAWPTFLGRWRISEIRHVQVTTPFFMMLAVEGLVLLWGRSLARHVLVVLLSAHFLLFVLLNQILLVDVLAVAPPDNTLDIQALRQIAPDLDEGSVIMTRKPNRAAYYTDQSAVMMPLAGFRDIMVYARQHGVTHLLAAPRELDTRPGLAEGLATAGDQIRLAVDLGRVQIYEIVDYGFLESIEEGGPLDQEVDLTAPAPPPDWGALVRRADPSTLEQAWLTVQKWRGATP